jgi:hypothetical protein
MVPPVPTAATTMSTLPSVSFQISSAVVLMWMAGFAGLLNCWGIQEFGVSWTRASALAIAPLIPSEPGVRTSFAPSMAKSVRRSRLIVSGMVRIILYPFAAATKASAMPVFPLVGSTDHGSRLEDATLLGVLDHGHADTVFHTAERIEKFTFERDRGRESGGYRD